jgi:hypothetical protein
MTNLNNMTVKELRQLAKDLKLKGYTTLNKEELINFIESAGVNYSSNNFKGGDATETIETVVEENTVEENTIENNTNNKGEKKMKAVCEMTRNELLKAAKENGIKGAMKMQDRDIVVKLENILYADAIAQAAEAKDELTMLIARRRNSEILSYIKRRSNKAKKKMIKKNSKTNTGVAYYQVVAKAVVDETVVNSAPKVVYEVNVATGLESSIARAAKKAKRKIADESLFLEMNTTHEIVMFKLDPSLYDTKETGYKIAETDLANLRLSLFDTLEKDGLRVVINENGLASVDTKTKAEELSNSQKAVNVKFLGISPSGLRTRTLVLAAVSQETNKNTINIDRRDHLLDSSMDGAFSATFKNFDGSMKDLGSKDVQFKGLGRLSSGLPGSKKMDEVSTMICFDNLAAGCTMKTLAGLIVSAKDIKDGATFTNAALAASSATKEGTPVTEKDFIGVIDQIRGAALKCSTQYMDLRDLITLVKRLLSKDSAAEVSYVIVNGVRFDSEYDNKVLVKSAWDKVVAAGLENEFFANLQTVVDENAMKLTKHNNKFNLVKLKMAYKSDMDMSMVTAIACMLADPENAADMLFNKAIKGITDKFRQLGANFTLDANNNIQSLDLDLDVNTLNNEKQFMTYLRKCDFKKTVDLFPASVRSDFDNTLKGIAGMIEAGNIPLDKSYYSVVQADPSVLFNLQILAEDEIIGSFLSEKRVAITRHPISSLTAVTTLNVVSQEEALERILESDVDVFAKRFLVNAMINVHECVIIPASHFLMEKHDGMDFDIDAVQVIEDQDVVDCLAKLPNIGSVIKTTDKAKADRLIKTPEEEAITSFQRDPRLGLKKPSVVTNVVTNEEEKQDNCGYISADIMANYNKKQDAKQKKVYDLSYTSSLEVVRKFFEVEMATVGEIATAFYNNSLIKTALESAKTPMQTKKLIVQAFNKYYGINTNCNSNKPYVSTIDRTVDTGKWSKGYEVEKFDCTDAIFRFQDSDGSIESLIAFLEDCCDYNRYLAETAIDAAKNNYYTANLFNHGRIIAALGAPANCDVMQVEADATFGKIAQVYGVSEENYFQIELLSFRNKKGMSEKDYVANKGIVLKKNIKGEMEEHQAQLSLEDPLFNIKKEMVRLTNRLTVLVAKALERRVKCDDAVKAREELCVMAARILEGSTPAQLVKGDNKPEGVHAKVAPTLDSIKRAYATATLPLAKVENKQTKDDKDSEINGLSKVEFAKKVAVSGIRNFARHAFSDFTSVEIGAIVCANLAGSVSTEKCGTINAALYKIFEGEILEFLSTIGFANAGLIGEAISYTKADGKLVRTSNYVGQTVIVVDGIGELADGTVFTMDNKKANITGTIVELNNKFYVQATREIEAYNPEDGMIYNVIPNDNYRSTDNMEVLDYRYQGVYELAGRKLRSAIIAVDYNDEYIVASLSGRGESNDLLKVMDLKGSNIFSFTNKNKNVCKIMHIPGSAYMAALEAMEADTQEELSLDFGMPVGLEPVGTEDNAESMDFAMPVFA